MSIAVEPVASQSPSLDPAKGKGVVLFDGMCPLCQRGVRILKRLDWFKCLHCQDCRDKARWPPCAEPLDMERLLEEMHAVVPNRSRAIAGYKAFRWMAWRLPLAVPIAPLLYIPGVPWIGNKMYLWVARNRYDLVPCEDGVCQLNLKKPEDRGQKPEGNG